MAKPGGTAATLPCRPHEMRWPAKGRLTLLTTMDLKWSSALSSAVAGALGLPAGASSEGAKVVLKNHAGPSPPM